MLPFQDACRKPTIIALNRLLVIRPSARRESPAYLRRIRSLVSSSFLQWHQVSTPLPLPKRGTAVRNREKQPRWHRASMPVSAADGIRRIAIPFACTAGSITASMAAVTSVAEEVHSHHADHDHHENPVLRKPLHRVVSDRVVMRPKRPEQLHPFRPLLAGPRGVPHFYGILQRPVPPNALGVHEGDASHAPRATTKAVAVNVHIPA